MATPPVPLDQMQGAVPDSTPIVASPGQQASPPSAIQGSINAGQVTGGPQLPPRPIGTSAAGQPQSKAEFFRNMLGQFFYAVGTGLANRGSGPGADARGAGAALTALPERDIALQHLDIARQQAEGLAAYHKSQAEALQNRYKPATFIDDQGNPQQLSADEFAKLMAARVTGKSREAAATTAATSRENVADTAATSRENVAATAATSRENVARTNAAGKVPTEIGLILKANAGDKEAAAAYQKLQEGRMQVRASSATMRPLNYYDPELQRNITMSAAEAESQQKAGKTLIQAGAVPSTTLLQMQRAQNAIPNAVDEVSKNLGAWDNAGDKAIFARILKDVPHTGDTSTWLGNVLDQSLNAGLSPEGQNAVISLRRLNESLGTLRAISGLPSTTGSMMATAALLPGGTTPDSKFAKKQLDQIKTLVQQETGVPFLGGGKSGVGKLSEAEAMDYLKQAGGDANKARAMAKKDGRTF